MNLGVYATGETTQKLFQPTRVSAARKTRDLTLSIHSPSPTLPLEKDEDVETEHAAGKSRSTSVHNTTGSEHGVSVARKAITPGLQKEKSGALSVLKPVPSRISKQLPRERSSRRCNPRKYSGPRHFDTLFRSFYQKREGKRQNSSFVPMAALPAHQLALPIRKSTCPAEVPLPLRTTSQGKRCSISQEFTAFN